MEPESNPAVTGGIWTDENLLIPIEWEGTPIPQQPGPSVSLDPKTTTERVEDILSNPSSNRRGSDVDIAAIKKAVLLHIIQELGSRGDSLRSAFQALLMPIEKRIKDWVQEHTDHTSQLQSTTVALDELRGQVELMRGKMDEIVSHITKRSDAENEVLAQAMELIQAKHASEPAQSEVEAKLTLMAARREQLAQTAAKFGEAELKEKEPVKPKPKRRGHIY